MPLKDTNLAPGATSYNGTTHGAASPGRSQFAARSDHVHPVRFSPGASNAPVNNGDVTIEVTSNTTLTIKVKGSDGTVRSVALTLA